MNRFSDKKLLLLIGALVIGSCVFMVTILRLWHESTDAEQEFSRAQLKEVINELKQGMTREEVYLLFENERWTAFSEEKGEIRLWTKPQPLPANWIVRLLFEDDRLKSVRFGTADNINKRPHDAPPDMWEDNS